MKRAILPFIAFLLLAIPAFPKGETIKIMIEGPGLKAPITLADPQILASFNIWSGPGTFGCNSVAKLPCDPDATRDVKTYAPSFVVDWSQGFITAPSPALPRYKISFCASNDPSKLAYVVTYVFDPTRKAGYIYLPGENEDGYYINNGSLRRSLDGPEVEGNLFRAWTAWDKVASPLLTSNT
jgi:hypothetical protein